MNPEDRLAPIFIVADDDARAVDRLLEEIYAALCFFIPVMNPRQVVRYSRSAAATAVFLADRMRYARGGSERLLQELLDLGKQVVILAEDWTPQNVERWKRMGAQECLPHPTRSGHRFELLRRVIQEFTIAKIAEGRGACPSRGEVTSENRVKGRGRGKGGPFSDSGSGQEATARDS